MDCHGTARTQRYDHDFHFMKAHKLGFAKTLVSLRTLNTTSSSPEVFCTFSGVLSEARATTGNNKNRDTRGFSTTPGFLGGRNSKVGRILRGEDISDLPGRQDSREA